MMNFTKRLTAMASFMAMSGMALLAASFGQGPQRVFLTPQDHMEIYADQAKSMANGTSLMSAPMRKAPVMIQELEEPEILLYEDFSLMSAGSEESPDPNMLPEDYFDTGNQFLPDGYTLTSGWWGLGIYQAGGTCFLGYPNYGGVITTPMLNLNGRIRISFRAKPGAEIKSVAQMLVSVLYGDVFVPEFLLPHGYEIITMEKGADWQEYSSTYDIPYTGDDVYIQFNGAMRDNGKFIDDIKIERLAYILSTPVAQMPEDYTGESFTAKWNKQGSTDDYLITAWSQSIPEGGFEVSTDFSDEALPEGITLNANPKFENIPGTSDKALKVINGTELTVDAGDGLINSLILSISGIDTSKEGQMCSMVWIEYGMDDNWVEYGNIEIPYTQNKNNQLQVVGGLGMPENRFSKIRLQFLFQSYTEYAYVDDIELVITPEAEIEFIAQQLPVAGTSYTFTGLNPENDYFYYVQAVLGEEVSEASNTIKGYLLTAPEVLEATDIDPRGGFTANWQPVAKAEEYNVSVFSIRTVDSENEEFPIFEDSFANVPENATLSEPLNLGNSAYPMGLDDYTDVPGWMGINNIVAENMIGCGDFDGAQLPVLMSPYFDASNNSGLFTLEFDVWGTAQGDILAVQHKELDYDFVYLSDEIQHCSMTFDKGSKESYLLFYTYYQHPFLIGNLKITQTLPQGTQLMKLVAQSEWVDTTEYYFADLKSDEQNQLCYKVNARYMREGQYYTSPDSELMNVTSSTSSINPIKGDSDDNSVYDLLGRKVIDNGNLRPGLYIQNGKLIKK